MTFPYPSLSIEAAANDLCRERYGRALCDVNATIASTLRGEVRRMLDLLEPVIAERVRAEADAMATVVVDAYPYGRR